LEKTNRSQLSIVHPKLLQKVGERIKAKDIQLKEAKKHVDILQSINLGHQKTMEEKDNKIKSVIGGYKS